MGEPAGLAAAVGRRRLLRWGVAGACALAPLPAFGAQSAAARALAFYNLHTGESLATTYWENGRYLPEALAEIDVVLRDFRTGEVQPIDPDLLDLLSSLRETIGSREAFAVISGYRSPKTNAALAAASGGVAKKSLHMQGMAIDVRLPGYELSRLRDAAIALQRGGVGFYPGSDFVHLDTGRVRHW